MTTASWRDSTVAARGIAQHFNEVPAPIKGRQTRWALGSMNKFVKGGCGNDVLQMHWSSGAVGYLVAQLC